MKHKFNIASYKCLSLTIAVLMCFSFLIISCDARGSASHSTSHSSSHSSGYHSGSYSSSTKSSSSKSTYSSTKETSTPNDSSTTKSTTPTRSSTYSTYGGNKSGSSTDTTADTDAKKSNNTVLIGSTTDSKPSSGSGTSSTTSNNTGSESSSGNYADSGTNNSSYSTYPSSGYNGTSTSVVASSSGAKKSSGGGGFIVVVIILAAAGIVIYKRKNATKKDQFSRAPIESFDMNKELEACKELYSTLIFGIDDIDDFLEKSDLDRRKCIKLLPVLNEYKGLLQKALEETKDETQVPASLHQFRTEHFEELEKLKDCAKCKCLNCARDCNMAGCERCDPSFRCKITSCDNKTAAVYDFDDKWIDLINNDTGVNERLKVLAVIQDLEFDQLYIILKRENDKLIMYYYPSIDEDTYGEITDSDDMDFAVKAFENQYVNS